MKPLYFGIVHPWLCDVMGHLTTRHYMAMFDEASYQLLSISTGWSADSEAWKDKGWADIRHEINYKAELKVGSLIEISGQISNIGRSSLSLEYEMKSRTSGQLAATMDAKTVFFDLKNRCAIPVTDEIRGRIEDG